MKFIRNILLQLLGLERYLRLVSKTYIAFVSRGFWKAKYPELFYLDEILKPGNTCVDIGANLGYYSTRMAKLVGAQGKVFAVEPIPLFGKIWKSNVKPEKNTQVTLFPYALGETAGTVQMGIPEKDGRMHHGMTKIASSKDENYVKYFDVEMRNPDVLLKDLQELHFIKCDVEGYESVVFQNLQETLKKFKPLVQSELSGDENRNTVINLFTELGYTTNVLRGCGLVQITKDEAMTLKQDFYFSC